jgi:hypothetical protein
MTTTTDQLTLASWNQSGRALIFGAPIIMQWHSYGLQKALSIGHFPFLVDRKLISPSGFPFLVDQK